MMIAPDGTAYEIKGPANAPVVVMIHGLGLNRECWQWMIPAIVDRFRVLSYDLFGHGDSADPPVIPDLSMFSRQLVALLDHCEINRAAIVGFSLGGMIARRFAQDMPDRSAALVILHSPHKRSKSAQDAILKRVEQAKQDGPQATIEAALRRWFTDDFRKANPEMMETVCGWVLANKIDIYHLIYRVLADGINEITAPDPRISCPALILTGDQDFGNGPEMTHAIAAEIAGSQALVLTNLRHMALAENPQAVNQPVRQFLDGLRDFT